MNLEVCTQCDNRCFTSPSSPSQPLCCHEECAGGCTGQSTHECIVSTNLTSSSWDALWVLVTSSWDLPAFSHRSSSYITLLLSLSSLIDVFLILFNLQPWLTLPITGHFSTSQVVLFYLCTCFSCLHLFFLIRWCSHKDVFPHEPIVFLHNKYHSHLSRWIINRILWLGESGHRITP